MDKNINETNGDILKELEEARHKIAELKIIEHQRDWAEERLKESQERFHRLADATNEGIMIHDKGKIIDTNQTFAGMVGYSISELIGSDCLKLIDKKDRDRTRKNLLSEKEESYEVVGLKKDGSTFPIEIRSKSILDNGKKVRIAAIRDITHYKNMQDRLAKINRCFLDFTIDPKKNIERLVELCGQSLNATCALYNRLLEGGVMLCTQGKWNTPPDYKALDEAKGHICYDIIQQASDEPAVIHNLADTPYVKTDPNVKKYKLYTYVGVPVKLGDIVIGSLCAVYQKRFSPTEADKNLIKTIAAAIGIEEERRRAHDGQRQNLELYRGLIKASPDGIILSDTEGGIVMINQPAAAMYNFEHKENIIGRNLFDFVAGKDKKKVKAKLKNILDTENVITIDADLIKTDKTSFVAEIRCSLIKDAQGKPHALLSTLRDVTERKKAEEALRESRRTLATLMSNLPGMAYRCSNDKDWTMEFISEGCKQLTGYEPEDVTNNKKISYAQIIHENDRDKVWKGVQSALKKKIPFTLRYRIVHADGKVRWVWEQGQGVFSTDKKLLALEGFITDVTKRTIAEKEINALARFPSENPYAILRISDNGTIIYANKTAKSFCNKWGCSLGDTISSELLEVIVDAVETGLTKNIELTDEEGKIFLFSLVPVVEENYVNMYGFDITERERTEEVLRRSEQEKAMILDSVAEIVMYHDSKMRIVWANKAASESMGSKPGSLLGRRCHEVWHKRKVFCKNCPIKKAFKTGKPEQAEISSPDGKHWIVKGYPVKDGKGKVINMVEVALDISERKLIAKERQHSIDKSKRILEETVIALAATSERRDPYTAGHQRRVAELACAIAKDMGLNKDKIEGIRMAAIIHDVGKVYMPAEILSKPSRLTDLEFNIIKTHPQIGYEILEPVEFPWPVALIVLQHHEKINGSGYPKGVDSENILLEAKILTVADVVEAMASHRPYRAALGIDKALKEISNNKGTLYDPEVVEICINLFKKKHFKFNKKKKDAFGF